MGYNKFINRETDGTLTVLLDLSGDTVSPDTLAEGITAHNKHGDAIIGTFKTISNSCTEHYTVNASAIVKAGDFVEFRNTFGELVSNPDTTAVVQPATNRSYFVGVAKTGGSAGEIIEVYCVNTPESEES